MMHNRQCFEAHMGLWMMRPVEFNHAMASIRAGTYKMLSDADLAAMSDAPMFTVDDRGIATISLEGAMMKGRSKFGGTSTTSVRRGIREALSTNAVNGIMLHIDSPGGTAAGTEMLAGEVAKANKIKPTFAHIEDLGASAAFWVASQAGSISANATALIGSIGTISVVEDTSEAASMAGVKVHAITTGDHKTTGIDGVPITDEHLDHVREIVEGLNSHFLAGVGKGRGLSKSAVRAVADGKVHLADQAMILGLIDKVQGFDKSMADLAKLAAPKRSRSRSTAAAAAITREAVR